MKLALLGFANSLSIEGDKRNIHVNTIAPVAGSRMTETVLPPDLIEALKPEYVVPLVGYLCHEGTETNGAAFEVGAGWVGRLRWQRTQGNFWDISNNFTPESVRDGWDTVSDWSSPSYPTTLQDSVTKYFNPVKFLPSVMSFLASKSTRASETASQAKGKNEHVDVAKALQHRFEAIESSYSDNDTMLYALAIGAAKDPLDPQELRFTYENSSDFSAIPTMGNFVTSCLTKRSFVSIFSLGTNDISGWTVVQSDDAVAVTLLFLLDSISVANKTSSFIVPFPRAERSPPMGISAESTTRDRVPLSPLTRSPKMKAGMTFAPIKSHCSFEALAGLEETEDQLPRRSSFPTELPVLDHHKESDSRRGGS